MRPLIYGGNRLQLLEGGAEFFPRLLAAIDGAQRSIHLETYIFADDATGAPVAAALAQAAGRGVVVRVVVDGYGSGSQAEVLAARLRSAGVAVAVFRRARLWRLERRLLRRLHRKLALIDERIAFIGGINIQDDRRQSGARAPLAEPRWDYAVQCEGPVVAAVSLAMKRLWRTLQLLQPRGATATMAPIDVAEQTPVALGARAALLLRDNLRNRRTIEDAYLEALAGARRNVLIACAYFLPGHVFRHALVDCAQRGVRVVLLVQGRIEYALQHYAQEALYARLLAAGVEIHEYVPSYLHAKVAVVDDHWATVGSSNIDPYSLLLAREANLAVYDAPFAGTCAGRARAARRAAALRAPRPAAAPAELGRLRHRAIRRRDAGGRPAALLTAHRPT
jgi:cardiolipin synthase